MSPINKINAAIVSKEVGEELVKNYIKLMFWDFYNKSGGQSKLIHVFIMYEDMQLYYVLP